MLDTLHRLSRTIEATKRSKREPQMNSSERILHDLRVDAAREETRQRIWGAPGPTNSTVPLGMGNLSGWVVAAAMIGAPLGGIAGQGIGGAILGALIFGGTLWFFSAIAKRTGAYHRDSRPMVWTASGAAVGAAIGVILSITSGEPLWYAVKTLAIFLGGLSGIFCWISRGSARRDYSKESLTKYNEEWDRKHGYGPSVTK